MKSLWISSDTIVTPYRSASSVTCSSSSRVQTRPTGLWGLHRRNMETPERKPYSMFSKSMCQPSSVCRRPFLHRPKPFTFAA